jgi:hypothetical protein
MFPKLLRGADDHSIPAINVESKGYIMVRLGTPPGAMHVYWHLVDPLFSLLELGFEWPSGRLFDCSVPLFNGEVEDGGMGPPLEPTKGTPFFDLSEWSVDEGDRCARGNFLKQSGRLRVLRGMNAVSIVVKQSPRRRSLVCGESLICDFDKDDELCALTLLGSFLI